MNTLKATATRTLRTPRRAAAIRRHSAALATVPTITLVQYAHVLESRPTLSRTAEYYHERIMNAIRRRGVLAMNHRAH